MSEHEELPKIPEYVSVKEAAAMLHISDKMVYSYVENRRIKAVRAANTIMIPMREIEAFQFRSSGRPRTTIPEWHTSKKENALHATFIVVQVRTGHMIAFLSRLEEIRKGKSFTFPGTVARYIMVSEQDPERVEMLLVWKRSVMPSEEQREQALAEFREALDDVLDWGTAQSSYSSIVMHT